MAIHQAIPRVVRTIITLFCVISVFATLFLCSCDRRKVCAPTSMLASSLSCPVIIDQQGKIIKMLDYADAQPFVNGYAAVKSDDNSNNPAPLQTKRCKGDSSASPAKRDSYMGRTREISGRPQSRLLPLCLKPCVGWKEENLQKNEQFRIRSEYYAKNASSCIATQRHIRIEEQLTRWLGCPHRSRRCNSTHSIPVQSDSHLKHKKGSLCRLQVKHRINGEHMKSPAFQSDPDIYLGEG